MYRELVDAALSRYAATYSTSRASFLLLLYALMLIRFPDKMYDLRALM